jgi:hypothetical protein
MASPPSQPITDEDIFSRSSPLFARDVTGLSIRDALPRHADVVSGHRTVAVHAEPAVAARARPRPAVLPQRRHPPSHEACVPHAATTAPRALRADLDGLRSGVEGGPTVGDRTKNRARKDYAHERLQHLVLRQVPRGCLGGETNQCADGVVPSREQRRAGDHTAVVWKRENLRPRCARRSAAWVSHRGASRHRVPRASATRSSLRTGVRLVRPETLPAASTSAFSGTRRGARRPR